MNKRIDNKRILLRIDEEVLQDIYQLSDKEILAEAKEDYADPLSLIRHTKKTVILAIMNHRKTLLAEVSK